MNWYVTEQIKTAFKQEDFESTFGDYQRFVVDAYDIKCYLTTLSSRIAIAMNIYNMTSGGMCYQQFWAYDKGEESRAKSTFKQITAKVTEVVDYFTKEEEFAPNSMIAARLRAATWEIDRKGMARTNIPWVNYSIDKAVYEKDWRNSIYGNRYPERPTTGY